MTDARRYVIDGARYTLAEMLDANAEDVDTCEWLRAAQPGDVLHDFHGEEVSCVGYDMLARRHYSPGETAAHASPTGRR